MYACIDLGSNSFHLLIAEWSDGESQLIERCSEKLQLGERVRTNGIISPEAFDRGLECLQHFKSLISSSWRRTILGPGYEYFSNSR